MVLNNNYFSREIVVQTIFYLAITAVLQAGNAQKKEMRRSGTSPVSD